jgi:hypothetical protein
MRERGGAGVSLRDCARFPPEEAEALIEKCHRQHVHAPEAILRNFVGRYLG